MKDVKIGKKDAPKRILEILRKVREQPIPKEILEIVEGYQKEQEKKRKIASALKDSDI